MNLSKPLKEWLWSLFDTFDKLLAFGKKHLNDSFVLDGVVNVSARDRILRELISNSLAHRDYASGFIAKFVIEEKRLYTENANRAHGSGVLDLRQFEPFPKNPPISRVFREVGLADELGSGMRNTHKYTALYTGGIPTFTEGDIFRITVPLTANQVTNQVTNQVEEDKNKLVEFCVVPRSANEMMLHLHLSNRGYFRQKYIVPLLQEKRLVMTIPEKPQSRFQKYIKNK